MAIESPIYTATVGKNAPVLADILRLYVKKGASGCDVTFGKGVFWSDDCRKHVGELLATDLQDGICASDLPHGDGSQDFHVFDPPYICGFFRPNKQQEAQQTHGDFHARYGNHAGGGYKGLHYHPAVKALYTDGLAEAWRVLRKGGVQITKVQDEVSNHKQHLTHVHVVNEATKLGFTVLDLFVVVRTDKPHCRRMNRQEHARKNHSFFLVFKK